MKKILLSFAGGILVVAIAVAAIMLFGGSKDKISFKSDIMKTTIVDEICDLTKFIEYPEGAQVELTAEYVKDGQTLKYLTAGLSYKPTYVGEVSITATIVGTDIHAKTTMEVIEARPTIVTVNEAKFDKDATIKLNELISYITYVSSSEPELIVKLVEFEALKIDLTGKTEYTFDKIGVYAFTFELKNKGGSVQGTIKAKISRAITANEKDDLTNLSFVGQDSHATIEMSDERAQNSDWSWKIKAFAGDFYQESNINYYMNHIWVKFDKEIDLSKQYITMDLKASADTAGIGIHYLTAANSMSEVPMGFQDVLGEWTRVSTEGKYDKGIYQGIYILLLHKKDAGTYDVNNVTALIDNLKIHSYQDPNSPVLVGGVTSYQITDNTIVLNSGNINDIEKSSFASINGKYSNETFEFVTTIKNPTAPNLMIGARMSKVGVIQGQNNGVSVRFYNDFFEVYAPKYGTTIGASNVTFLPDTKYTFSISVETVQKTSTLYLNIKDMNGKIILNYILTFDTQIPSSGSFAVWNLDATRTIEYIKPYVAEKKINVNKIVASTGQAGIARISSATPNTVSSAAFLAMQGKYTNEHFEFKAKIKDAKSPNLVIGVRMAGFDTNPDKYNGVVIRLYNEFLEIYAPKYGLIAGAEVLKLTSNTEYSFGIDVINANNVNTLNFVVKQGNTVILNLSKRINAVIPASGSFVVWSLDESTVISYKMPNIVVLPSNINKIVKSTEAAGTATISTIEQNKVEKAAFLALQGNYTNEHFEFKSTIKDDKVPNLVIGARMTGFDANPDKYDGVLIRLYNGFLEIYAPKYGMLAGAEAIELQPNTEYTFGIDVITENNIKTLNFIIKHENTIVISLSKNLDVAIPTSGSFVVWTMDAQAVIDYLMPKIVEIPSNVNKIVASTEVAGTATISTIEQNKVDKAAYLAMQGNYTNEHFEFVSTIKDDKAPNLVIGARMAGFDSNPDKYNGVVVRIYDGFLEVYAPKYGLWEGAVPVTLTANTEYTFGIDVITKDNKNTLSLVIKSGSTIVLSYTKTIDESIKGAIPTSGSFVVWSMDESTTISYIMPYIYVAPSNVNKVIESNGTAGTATIGAIEQNKVDKAAFLAMNGNYTNEKFVFDVTIKDAVKPNLIIGARMEGYEENPDKHEGVTIRIYGGFLEIYAPKYGTWIGAAAVTLTSNTNYTFAVDVLSVGSTNTLTLTIKQGNTVVLTTTKAIGAVIPASGSFVVWSMDETTDITYKMPE